MAMYKKPLSGSSGNGILGLKDITGEYPSSNGDPVVVQWRVNDAFGKAVDKAVRYGSTMPDQDATPLFPIGWKPAVSYG